MRNFSYFDKSALVRLALLVSLGLLAPSAFAAANDMPGPGGVGSWSVYAFGNAQAVADAFKAINNFSTSAVFKSMVGFLALVGVLVMGLSSGFNASTAKRLIGYCVGVFMVTYVLFGISDEGGPLRVKVEILDSVDGTWKAPVTVPAVVGIPAAVISTAGYEITRQIEASFPLPDAMKLSNGAPFNLAAAMLQDASKARITDPNFASSLAYYVQDCFVMGVATGYLSPSTLISSTDFLNDIKYPHPGVMVNTLLSTDSVGIDDVVSCAQAWTLIDGYLTTRGSEAAHYLNKASAWERTPALSVVNSGMDAVAQWTTNSGITNGGSMVKQAAMLASFTGAYSQAAAATGNSDFLTGLALNQAYEAQTTGWVVGAEVFNRLMGYIFAVIQVFVYSITPFVLAAALIPGLGFALLRNFLQIALWLAIWQPMLAIVNFIVMSMQQAELGGAFASAGGTHGFTLANMGVISEKTANLRAASSFIGTMVPALAWALVKGSVDFSRVIGSAVGENFAQQASNTMTTGNYSLNQASMDSFTANKHSIAPSSATGDGFNVTGQNVTRKLDPGGVHPVTIGGQAVAAGVTSSTQVNDGGNIADQTSNAVGGSSARGTAEASQHGTSGALSASTSNVLASQGGTSVAGSGSVSFNGTMPVVGGKSANAMPGGGLGMPSNQLLSGGGGAVSPPANLEGSPGRGTINLGGGISGNVGVSGSRTSGAQQQTGATVQETGSENKTATDSKQATEAGTKLTSAGDTRGHMSTQSMSISGPASAWERAMVANEAMRITNPRSTSDGESPVHAGLHQMMQPHAVPKMVDDMKGDVAGTQAKLDGRVDALRGDAIGGMDAIKQKAGATLDTAQSNAHDKTDATKPAAHRAGVAVMGVGQEISSAVADVAKKGAERAGKLGDTVKDMFTKDGSAPALTPAEREQSSQPAMMRPKGDSAPAESAPSGGQPAMHVSPQHMQPIPIPMPPPTPPAVPSAPQAQLARAPEQQAPGVNHQVNQDPSSSPKQAEREQSSQPAMMRPKGDSAPAESAPSGGQPAMHVSPQHMQPIPIPMPPPTPPALPSAPQAQLAQAPEQQAPGVNHQVNQDPFSSPKQAAVETQLHNAQHRSEQLEQQRRNADNILLGSAESTNVDELQGAIRDARDYTNRG